MEEVKVNLEEEKATKEELNLLSFVAVDKFKSVRRAIKRGNVSITGAIFPKRPFNNRKSDINGIKKMIYANIKTRRV